MAKQTQTVKNEHQKEFIRLFDSVCGRYSRYEVWQDFVLMLAVEISNSFDSQHKEKRSELYRGRAKKYTEKDRNTFAEMVGQIILGMEENQDQDFLGDLYMSLELGNSKAGQFFTPYCICKAMSKITAGNLKAQVEERHWIGVNDPACGAGATLIAFANTCKEAGINYQRSVLFVAQDIDYTVGCMCYIQLSLMGCPGYVCIADTITNPCTCYDNRGLLPAEKEGQDIWYTPMFASDVWHLRRQWANMDLLFRGNKSAVQEAVPEVAAPEVEPSAESALNATETGQLTLF